MATTVSPRSRTKREGRKIKLYLYGFTTLGMAAKSLPRFLWVEILKISAYLKNRIPGPDPEIPYERFYNEKLNLSHLKV